MAEVKIDVSEMTDFAKELFELAQDELPKERDKFLRKEGNKLKKEIKKVARHKVGKVTGNYYAGIKRGKVFTNYGDRKIRVYGGSPHTHLIEKGHNKLTKSGKIPKTVNEGAPRRVEGRNVYEEGADNFDKHFESDCEEWVEELLESELL